MTVADAYGARSDEYAALFGDIASTHPADRELIAEWVAGQDGAVIDLGCGPGQWTGFLHRHGADVVGIDLTPEFVRIARSRHPGLDFRVGDARRLDLPDGSGAGLLAWYSLIHLPPEELPAVLAEFRRVLRPGGGLLVGFFDGADAERFPHAVTPAWFWPPERLAGELTRAGFEVVRTVRRQDPGVRAHAAIVARAAGPRP